MLEKGPRERQSARKALFVNGVDVLPVVGLAATSSATTSGVVSKTLGSAAGKTAPPQPNPASGHGSQRQGSRGTVLTKRPNGNTSLRSGSSTDVGLAIPADGAWAGAVVGSCEAS